MGDLLIPKKFHWIWIGGTRLPEEFKGWIEGWLRLHPGWDGHIWTEADLPKLVNHEFFEIASSPAQKADIVRYEIVFEHGGVYVDTDLECLRNLEPILPGIEAFVGEEEPGRVANSLFGARAKHPWLKKAIDRLGASFRSECSIVENTGPNFLAAITKGRSDVHIFSPEFFCPYTWRQPHRAHGPFPSAYAVHHWSHSWGGASAQRAARIELKRELEAVIPPGESFLVATNDFAVELKGGRVPVSILQTPSLNWGMPADDYAAVSAVESLLREGFTYLAFDVDTRWWLKIYPHFNNFLRDL